MDMQSGRGLPKNFRQIGSAEKSTKVYIEDYVYTFMRKLSREGEVSVGALIGNNVIREGVECVFISGMVRASEYVAGNGRITITDNTWATVFENVKKYFDGMTVCGWFISSQDREFLRLPMLSGINNCGNHETTLVYIRDKESDEDCVYRVTAQEKDRLSGYYIYYERNEQMQEYMIDTTGTKSVDPPPVNIMNRLKGDEPQKADEKTAAAVPEKLPDKNTEGRKRSSRAMYIAASLLILSFVAVGVSVYQNGTDGMFGKIKEVVASVPINGSEKESRSESEPESASGIIIENAPGIVESTQAPGESLYGQPAEGILVENTGAAAETLAAEASTDNEAEGQTEPAAVPESIAEGTVQPESEDPPEESQGAEPAAVSGSTYVVQAGDTLTSICVKMYGKEDMAKIEEIRNVNNLENADYIFVGQVISIP